jgi:predicted ribosome-associated RNA-binding protein Tma20
MSELIVVNTNASVKKRKTKQTKKENVLIRTTEEIVVVAETRETKTDIAVTTAEMKRTTKKNERGTAIHLRRITKSKSRQHGTLTQVLLST